MADSDRSSARDLPPAAGRSVGYPNPEDSHDVDPSDHRSAESHTYSSRQHVSYSHESHDFPHSSRQQASYSQENQSLPHYATSSQQHQSRPHYSASSQQATSTAEQIKDVISQLAAEAVEKRAEALIKASRDHR